MSGDILVGSGGQPQNASNAAGSGTISGDGKSLTVVINDGFTASGIVVKGADSYNVYTGPFVGPITLTPLVAPLSNGGQVPGVSHWYVCGTTTTTTTTTTSSSSSSSSSSSPGTPPGSTPPGGNLPLTGVAVGGFVAAGVALIAGGIALLFFRRRRDVTDAS